MLEWHDFETDPPKQRGKYLTYDRYKNIRYFLWSDYFDSCWEEIPKGTFTWWEWDDRGWVWHSRTNIIKWAKINLPEVKNGMA